VAWQLLAAFSQVYSENWGQHAEWEDLKNVPFGQKRSIFKVVDK
jgi:hypothetical protein